MDVGKKRKFCIEMYWDFQKYKKFKSYFHEKKYTLFFIRTIL